MQGLNLGRRLGTMVLAAAAFLGPAPWVAAQTVEVPNGQRVVIGADGSVRVEGPKGRTTVTEKGVVTSDWRTNGTVLAPSEVDRVLAELGGVVVGGRIQMTLGDAILFDLDSAAIRPDAARQLQRVAGVIRARAADRVLILGHTDSMGSDAHNLELSYRRAEAVKRWLVLSEGIPASFMAVQGVGAAYPVASNRLPDGSDNPAGRARNRRVEIQVATRPGVTLGPGTIVVEPGRVIPGGGAARQSDTSSGDEAEGDSCTRLCAVVGGRHGAGVIGCMEGTLEELGFEMDAAACDELEDAMFLGSSHAGRLCTTCRTAEGWTETACSEVLAHCFGGR